MLVKHLFAFLTVVFVLSKVLFIEVSFATMPSKDRVRSRRKEVNKFYYETIKDTILSDRKDKYDKDKRSGCHNEDYYRDVVALRMKSAESSKVHYEKDLETSYAELAKTTKKHYEKDLEMSRAESAKAKNEHYEKDLETSRAELAKMTKKHYEKNLETSCAESAKTTKKHYEKI